MRARLLFVIWCLVLATMSFGQARRGAFRISGKVVNASNGEPLAHARLELAPTEGSSWVKAALTPKNGSFEFDGLAPGKYQLFAERAGFPRQGFDEHQGGFLSAIVTGTGVDSEHLVFRLQPGASISGVVSDDYNEPVRNAEVMVFARELRNGKLGTYMVGREQTDDRGYYKFGPTLAGTYYVAVSAHPWYAQNMLRRVGRDVVQPESANTAELNVAYPLTYFSDVTDESEASAIKVRSGDAFQADFHLRAVPAVTLHIPTSRGEQRESVHLTQKVFDEDSYPAQMQEMTSHTERVISGFAPGHYILQLQGARNGANQRSQPIDLYGDTTLDLDSIGGQATASITGIASAEDVKLKNAFIQFRNRDTDEVQADRIKEDGTFSLPMVPAGTYEVSVANSQSVYLANLAVSNATSSGRTIEIPAGASVNMAIILAKGVGEIKGTAVRNEKGVSGVLVLLVPDDPQNHVALFRRDQSDSDGTFTLRQVVPGRYTLLAIENGWDLEWTNPADLKRFLGKGAPVQVEPNGKYDLKVAVQQNAGVQAAD